MYVCNLCTYVCITLHYIALHCITLHYIIANCIATHIVVWVHTMRKLRPIFFNYILLKKTMQVTYIDPNIHAHLCYMRTCGPPYEHYKFLKNGCDCSFEWTLQCSHGTVQVPARLICGAHVTIPTPPLVGKFQSWSCRSQL